MTLRVLVAKVGFDGHDRGVKVVARILRDAGIEVVYGGLRQTPASIATIAADEDVDVIGISMHNGAHLTLAPAVIESLRNAGTAIPVVVGGIVPTVDIPALLDAGVAAVLRPGASDAEIVASVRGAVEPRSRPNGEVPQLDAYANSVRGEEPTIRDRHRSP